MVHICLWGNASDLSFALQGDASTLQEKHHRADANKNILVVHPRSTRHFAGGLDIQANVQNDLSAAWDSISTLSGARIDIILDNAGFELYADLIFTLYLLSTGIAETIVLHPKSIPWYITCYSRHSR
jgi:hypothetical protein